MSKYTYEYIVQGNYGTGWDDLTSHAIGADARAERKVYDANEPYPHRVVYRRSLNTDLQDRVSSDERRAGA